MLKIKYDMKLMSYISLFGTMTKTRVKDCFIDDLKQLVFVVQEGEIGKAIGKKGSNVKRLEMTFKRKIKIVEFSPDLMQFIKNLIYPIQAKDFEKDEEKNIVTIKSADLRSRGYLIGKGAQNLRNFEKIIKKYFELEELKVV